MRRLALVVTCACACSESRYGTYLMIDSGRIEFDHVELFFGKVDQGDRVPTSPQHLQPVFGNQLLDTRSVDASDAADLDGPATTFNFYIPDSAANRDLATAQPTYVMVIASSAGHPVAIGEQIGFELVGDSVFEYPITLVPFDAEAEMWGYGGADCVRWRHERDGDPPNQPSTIAVVRHGDRDCDGYPDDNDCNRLLYCGPENPGDCAGITPCIADNGVSCAIGACSQNGSPDQAQPINCAASTCILAAACMDSCADPSDPPEKRLACAFNATTHTEVIIPLTPMELLCTSPYTFMLSVTDCTNPTVVYPFGGVEADGFAIEVTSVAVDMCKIAITAPQTGDPRFKENDDHVIIEVDAQVGDLFPRTTFVFGIHPGATDVGSCAVQPVVQPGTGPEICR